MNARTSGVVAIVTLAGCAQQTPTFVVPPYPTVVTRQPLQGGTTDVAPSPSARPSIHPTEHASRSRRGLPTVMLRIRSCESGPNGYATHGWAMDYDYTLTNPASTASGGWQFLDGTWRSTSGLPGRAKDYPPVTQDATALKLYRAEGTRPWNASRPCWGA